MKRHHLLAACAGLLATGVALAHPGHTDQSIHVGEWLIAALTLAALIGGIVHLRRKARARR